MKQGKAGAAPKTFLIDTLYDIAGSALYAIGVYTFAKSADFAPGGVTGLALIFNHLFGLPIGVTSLVLNIPVILISYRVVGRRFLLKSFRTMVVSTVFIDVLCPLTPMYTGNNLLAALFSGVFMGAGLALVYMRGSSTGGTDFLLVTIRTLKPHLSMGQLTLMVDLTVILVGGLVFRNIDAVLYGTICTYASSIIIDKLMCGAGGAKLAIIVTDKGADTARRISDETGRGATLLPATGAFSGEKRDLLLCVCGKAEVFKVRAAAHEVDPGAFVTITDAAEVIGEGFSLPPDVGGTA